MHLNLDRIRGLCFDIDGTLCDTDDMWLHKIEKLMQPVKKIFPRHDTLLLSRRIIMGVESPGNMVYHLLDRFNLDDEIAWIFNKLSKIERDRPLGKYWIIAGVEEVLDRLSARFPMSVVSAKGEGGTLEFLNQYSLLHYFTTVVTSQTCRYTKPYPDPIIRAAREMGVKPEECLMIGDTTVDIRAGRAAGAQTVGVLCGFGQEEELRRARADVIVPGPLDLLKLLSK